MSLDRQLKQQRLSTSEIYNMSVLVLVSAAYIWAPSLQTWELTAQRLGGGVIGRPRFLKSSCDGHFRAVRSLMSVWLR